MKLVKVLAAVSVAAGMLMVGSAGVSAESTLEIVKKRGHMRCQVGKPSPGFYNLDANGNWYGSDVAVCKAIAAAVLGDAKKLEIQSVSTQARFTAMANGESDVLSRTTTWTLLRDSQLGLDFTAINFYDGQGFMVPKGSGIKSAMELKGATVCVLTGTTTELNLADSVRRGSKGRGLVGRDVDLSIRIRWVRESRAHTAAETATASSRNPPADRLRRAKGADPGSARSSSCPGTGQGDASVGSREAVARST